MRNARVFPLPVRAAPSTSFPFKETGKLFVCMSVMSTKKDRFKPSCRNARENHDDCGASVTLTASGEVGYWQIGERFQVRWGFLEKRAKSMSECKEIMDCYIVRRTYCIAASSNASMDFACITFLTFDDLTTCLAAFFGFCCFDGPA